jgi:HEAT repeat protein
MTSAEAIQKLSLYNSSNTSTGQIIDALEKIGRITSDFNLNPIKKLIEHSSANVRVLAIKNLAKIRDKKINIIFLNIYKSDKDTSVKREAISALGRQRDKEFIDFFIDVLKDDDPKIVCQAIRALLVFKGDKKIDGVLKKLISHENEMVKQVVEKEFFSKKY